MDTATPAEVQKIRLEDTSWILLDRTAKSCMSLANSYVTFWRKMLNFHSMWHHRRRIFHRIFRNRWTSASHQGRCQGEGEVLLLDAEDVNEKEKEKVMRHGSNLLWLKRLRQVWSTSLHKTNIRTQEINKNNQNSIETIKGRIESVFGSKSTANAVA